MEDRLGVQPAPVRFWQRFVGREPLLGVREGGRRLFVPMPGDSSGSGSPSTTDPCGSGGDNSEDERGVEQQEPQVPAFLSDGGAGFRWLGVYKRDLNVGPEGEDPRRATWDEIRMLHLDGELYNSRRDMLQPMRSLNIRDMCFVNNEDAEERREIVVPEESDAQGATDDEGLAIPIRASRELDRLPIRIQLEEEQVVFPEVQIKLGIDRREDAPASRPKYYRVELPPYIIGPHMHASTFMVVPNWGMSFESLQDAQRCVIFHRAFCTAIEEISHCDPAGEQPWHLSALLGSEGVQGWMLTRFENAVRSIKRDMDLLFNHVYGEPAVVQEIPLPRHGYPATPCQEYLYSLCEFSRSSPFSTTDQSTMRSTYPDTQLRENRQERRAHICLADIWQSWWSSSPDANENDWFELVRWPRGLRQGNKKKCVLRGADILRLLTREFLSLFECSRRGGNNKPNSSPVGPYIFHQSVFQRRTE